MEHCELCDKEFEHNAETSHHYEMEGECLCQKCLDHWEAMYQLKIDNLIDMERGK